MLKALRPLNFRVALVAFAAITVLAIAASTATAASVHLRVEGATKTYFSGDVTTNARSVPSGVDQPFCRADGNPSSFATANTITALADAIGDAKVGTSGTFYGWGTLLCSVDGEAPADKNGGWLVRINQQDSTSPNGYVTATDPLSDNDSVVLFFSPEYGHYSSSLELRVPAQARPGQAVTGYVDSFDASTDVKSIGVGAAISGGGANATSGADGSFQITFPTEGKFLVTASKSGAIRGSQWVTVAADAVPPTVRPISQKEINKQRRIAARAKCRATDSSDAVLKECIRNANQLGRTLTAKEKRIAAREKCVKTYPLRGSKSRVACVREANRIGR